MYGVTQDEADIVATTFNMPMDLEDTIELVELNVSELSRSYSSVFDNFVPGILRSVSCLDSCNGWCPDISISKNIPQFISMDVGYVETVHGVVLQDTSLLDNYVVENVPNMYSGIAIYNNYEGSIFPDCVVTQLRVEVSLDGYGWKKVHFRSQMSR